MSNEQLRDRMPDLATSNTASMLVNSYRDMCIHTYFVQ